LSAQGLGEADSAIGPDWIAHTELQALPPAGERHSLYLAVSRPHPLAEGAWETSLRMAPLLDSPVRLVGEDGWQALNIAMAFAENQLRDLIAHGWVLHLQDDPPDEPPLTAADLDAMWGRAPA
jgi:hypothetical protein